MRKRRMSMMSMMRRRRSRRRRRMERRWRNVHVWKGDSQSRSWSWRLLLSILTPLLLAELMIGRLRVILRHCDQPHQPVDVLAGVVDGDVCQVWLPRLAAAAGTVPALLFELSRNRLQGRPLLLHEHGVRDKQVKLAPVSLEKRANSMLQMPIVSHPLDADFVAQHDGLRAVYVKRLTASEISRARRQRAGPHLI
jgi:hypothetical protein